MTEGAAAARGDIQPAGNGLTSPSNGQPLGFSPGAPNGNGASGNGASGNGSAGHGSEPGHGEPSDDV